MTANQANLIYDLLFAACGADADLRADFVRSFSEGECREYRCCGAFGTGGKFYRDSQSWRVGCYREDETPELEAQIVAVNNVLATLRRLLPL